MRAIYASSVIIGISMLLGYTQAQKCNCECPEIHLPVCAADSTGQERNFPNPCVLDCYKCSNSKDYLILNYGECSGSRTPPSTARIPNRNNQKKPVVQKCNCDCARNYTPLCAANSNGTEQTFPNLCSLDCYKCTFNEDYVIRRQGECLTHNNARPNTPRPNISNQGNLPPAKCNCRCSLNYSPVCAVDSNGKEETFPTQCALDCYKCTHTKVYVKEKRGECSNNNPSPSHNNQRNPPSTKCKCQCSLNHAPICAVDSTGRQETFPNRCALDCYKCTHDKRYAVEKPGECSATSKAIPNALLPTGNNQRSSAAKCNCQCTFNYSPICAADSSGAQNTFPNQCALDCYKCTHNKAYVIRKQGECSETSTASSKDRVSNRNTPKKPAAVKCNCECSLNYSPICALGSEGQKTFPNQCALDCYQCTHNKEYVARKPGECSTTGAERSNSGTSDRNNQRKPYPAVYNQKQ